MIDFWVKALISIKLWTFFQVFQLEFETSDICSRCSKCNGDEWDVSWLCIWMWIMKTMTRYQQTDIHNHPQCVLLMKCFYLLCFVIRWSAQRMRYLHQNRFDSTTMNFGSVFNAGNLPILCVVAWFWCEWTNGSLLWIRQSCVSDAFSGKAPCFKKLGSITNNLCLIQRGKKKTARYG